MKYLSLLFTLILLGVSVSALSENYEQADVYRTLRAQALGVDAQLLESHSGIFALLMETSYEDAVATIAETAKVVGELTLTESFPLLGQSLLQSPQNRLESNYPHYPCD